jgi:hypothetical protein
MEIIMKFSVLVPALAAGLAFALPASAQQPTAPGQQLQDKGSVKGSPGASGYAPGQQMQDKGSVKGTTGASGYAPGHQDKSTGQKGSESGKIR